MCPTHDNMHNLVVINVWKPFSFPRYAYQIVESPTQRMIGFWALLSWEPFYCCTGLCRLAQALEQYAGLSCRTKHDNGGIVRLYACTFISLGFVISSNSRTDPK
jgi:hypothetical protein